MNKKQKGTVAVVVSFVAAIALAGTYTFRMQDKNQMEAEIAKEKTEVIVEESQDVVTENIINTAEEPEVKAEPEIEEVSEEEVISVHFDSSEPMLWPVNGTVLMSYNMEQTVYFKTLDQYRYNPAMIIAAENGEKVFAGTDGIVKDIQNTAKTGQTVQMDLGNGYEVFYGQLEDIQVAIGDYVKSDTVLGFVSDPSKYYSEEGSNLYFEIRKDGQPVNPVDFLE